MLPDLPRTIAGIADLADPWSDLYAASPLISTGVKFLHLAALLVAGGSAFRADRIAWRTAAMADHGERARGVAELARSQAVAVRALGVVLLSGALLALADVEGHAAAPIFWGKLLLVAALTGDTLVRARTPRRLHRALARDAPAVAPGTWHRLRAGAVLNGVLWLATILAGTVLSLS